MEKQSFWDKHIHIVAVVVLLIGITFIVLGPTWLTNASISSKYNFTETGNIGSTIGGITAPVVGLLTAILMYLAFYAQFRANKKQWSIIISDQKERKQNDRLELLWKLFDDLKTDIRTKEFEPNIVRLESGELQKAVFYNQVVHEVELILHDIVLLSDVLLQEVEKQSFPKQYQLVFRFKLESLIKLPVTIYDHLPEEYRTKALTKYYLRTVSLFEKIEKVII